MATTYQIIKIEDGLWEITRVDEPWRGVFEYEHIGRVAKDSITGLYHVELPTYRAGKSIEWSRQPRGYVSPKGAYRVIIYPPEKVLQ